MFLSSVLAPPPSQPAKPEPPAEPSPAEANQAESAEAEPKQTAPAEEASAPPAEAAQQPEQAAPPPENVPAPSASNSSSANALALSTITETEVVAPAAETRDSAGLSEAELRAYAEAAQDRPEASSKGYMETLMGSADLTDLVSGTEAPAEPRTVLTEAAQSYKTMNEYGSEKASELDTV